MSTERLFPEVSSEYKNPQTDISYTVGCYVPGVKAEATVKLLVHFRLYVPLTKITQEPASCPGKNCTRIQPRTVAYTVTMSDLWHSPVPAYTDEQYTTMWTVATAIALCGFALNVFMATTWGIGGWRYLSKLPFQLKACVVGGVVYGLVLFLRLYFCLLFSCLDMPRLNLPTALLKGRHVASFNVERGPSLRVLYRGVVRPRSFVLLLLI
jgi:hypothetical protein